MLVFQNKGMAAMMVYQTNPSGIELYFYAKSLLCFSNPIWLLVTWVKNALYQELGVLLITKVAEFFDIAENVQWLNKGCLTGPTAVGHYMRKLDFTLFYFKRMQGKSQQIA